jgi:hypothetical protein
MQWPYLQKPTPLTLMAVPCGGRQRSQSLVPEASRRGRCTGGMGRLHPCICVQDLNNSCDKKKHFVNRSVVTLWSLTTVIKTAVVSVTQLPGQRVGRRPEVRIYWTLEASSECVQETASPPSLLPAPGKQRVNKNCSSAQALNFLKRSGRHVPCVVTS